MARLEVLIAAYGDEGMARIANASHPVVDGVEYTVTWQIPEGGAVIPPEIASRKDFRVLVYDTRGLSVNRNHGLDASRGELVLISDDDLKYDAAGLRSVIEAFDSHPECDFLTFKFSSYRNHKYYPDREFDWQRPPKGSYVSSVEIAFRREKVVGHQRFNPHFGVNGDFCAGEEELFVSDMLRRGLTGHFIPLVVSHHSDDTTGSRPIGAQMIETKGAIFMRLHPRMWPVRMLAHAGRSSRPFWYCRHWLSGVKRARRLRVFEEK